MASWRQARRPARHVRHQRQPALGVRTPELVASSSGDYYKLSMQLRGSSLLLQDGKEALLTPGDIALYDTTRPYTLMSDDNMRHIVLMFPRGAIDLTTADLGELTATRLPADRAMCQVISPFLLRMAKNFESLNGVRRCGSRTPRSTWSPLCSPTSSTSGWRANGAPAKAAEQIKNFIEANLDDDRSRRARSPPRTTSRCASCTSCSSPRA